MTMDRRTKLCWMKDILEHLAGCCDQWDSADDHSERYLAESMRRDLEEFRRLWESMRIESTLRGSRELSAAA
jgi:hypothetical protein